jgi:hypothetical protein
MLSRYLSKGNMFYRITSFCLGKTPTMGMKLAATPRELTDFHTDAAIRYQMVKGRIRNHVTQYRS